MGNLGMKAKQLSIGRFKNRNGVVSFRVFGYLHGERVRRNFLTREEAAVEKAALEIRTHQVAAGYRTVLSTLSDTEAREAEAELAQDHSEIRRMNALGMLAVARGQGKTHPPRLTPTHVSSATKSSVSLSASKSFMQRIKNIRGSPKCSSPMVLRERKPVRQMSGAQPVRPRSPWQEWC